MAYDRDLEHLHPVLREKHTALMTKLEDEGLPFELFEGYRTPARQAWLYGQGRTRPGAIVTRARAWKSIHQYGLAGDYVLKIDGNWSWNDSGDHRAKWFRLHELAQDVGLRPLSFEKPHLQLIGIDLGDSTSARDKPRTTMLAFPHEAGVPTLRRRLNMAGRRGGTDGEVAQLGVEPGCGDHRGCLFVRESCTKGRVCGAGTSMGLHSEDRLSGRQAPDLKCLSPSLSKWGNTVRLKPFKGFRI